MAADVANSAAQYAAGLRQSLIKDLFEGDESQIDAADVLGDSVGIADLLGNGDVITLQVRASYRPCEPLRLLTPSL